MKIQAPVVLSGSAGHVLIPAVEHAKYGIDLKFVNGTSPDGVQLAVGGACLGYGAKD